MPEIKFFRTSAGLPGMRAALETGVPTFERVKKFADCFSYPEITVMFVYPYSPVESDPRRAHLANGRCWFSSPENDICWKEYADGTIGVAHPHIANFKATLGDRLNLFIKDIPGGTIYPTEHTVVGFYLGVTEQGDVAARVAWQEFDRVYRKYEMQTTDSEAISMVLGFEENPDCYPLVLDYIEEKLLIPLSDLKEMRKRCTKQKRAPKNENKRRNTRTR